MLSVFCLRDIRKSIFHHLRNFHVPEMSLNGFLVVPGFPRSLFCLVSQYFSIPSCRNEFFGDASYNLSRPFCPITSFQQSFSVLAFPSANIVLSQSVDRSGCRVGSNHYKIQEFCPQASEHAKNRNTTTELHQLANTMHACHTFPDQVLL